MQRNCHHGLLPDPLGHCSGPGFYRVHLCAPRDKGRASGQSRPWCSSPHLGKSEVARASPTNLICLDCPNVRCRFLICGAQPYLQWVWVCELCWSLGPLVLWVLWFPGAPFMVPLSWRSLVRTLVCVYMYTPPSSTPLGCLSAGSRLCQWVAGWTVAVRRRGCWWTEDGRLPTSMPCHVKSVLHTYRVGKTQTAV